MKNKIFQQRYFFITLILCVLLTSCDNNYTPKPRGYFRIDFPEKNYLVCDTIEAYSFEYPEYATITPDYYSLNEHNWVNIEFEQFEGTLHISHKKIDHNLNTYLEDTHTMLTKHISKANGIRDSLIINPERHVFGVAYSIEGKNIASPIQFYVTDSTTNFIRGALYFNTSPNNDSLAPIISFVKKDIEHFIETLTWKPYED